MIAVISDSHIPSRAEELPKEVIESLKRSQINIHAGDFDEKEVYNGIDEYGNLKAVKGNCDFFDLPNSEKFEYKGVKFGVYHGTGIAPRGDHDTLEKIALEDLEVDILITGHTHEEEITDLGDCLIINPGSCTGVGGGTSRESEPTYVTIEFDENQLLIELFKVGDESDIVDSFRYHI